jgi:putative Ca2+/H+ antiporter (TMEM165/GDT1 family)
MDVRLLVTVFATVLLAELGDKTQVSTMMFAASPDASKLSVFLGSALALVVSSAIGVVAGAFVGSWLNPTLVTRLAGLGFILVGVWTLTKT